MLKPTVRTLLSYANTLPWEAQDAMEFFPSAFSISITRAQDSSPSAHAPVYGVYCCAASAGAAFASVGFAEATGAEASGGTDSVTDCSGLTDGFSGFTAFCSSLLTLSGFACFGPVDNPQIAVFVLVENGGWGASVAAPIATLIAEYYINREVKRTDLEKRMMELNIR